MSPILGSIGSLAARAFGFGKPSGTSFTPVGSYDALATVTVPSGGTSSVTFSGIPNTYAHLQLRMLSGTNRASANLDTAKLTFNSDTGSNYTEHSIYGDGSSTGINAFGITNPTTNIVFARTGGNNTVTLMGATIVDFFDYASVTKNKTIRSLTGTDANGSGEIEFISGSWMNSSSSINNITITPVVGTAFNQYSSFSLYGVK
jgi:hypothetical protein